jgi:hypothetical protein
VLTGIEAPKLQELPSRCRSMLPDGVVVDELAEHEAHDLMGTPSLPATETTRQAHDLSHHKSIRMLRYIPRKHDENQMGS